MNSAEQWGKHQARIPKQMRTFEESSKSKKTVSSMIERKNDEKEIKRTGELRYRRLIWFSLEICRIMLVFRSVEKHIRISVNIFLNPFWSGGA